MLLIFTKEKVEKRSAYDDSTNHIRAHLIAARHEKFADDTGGNFKVTFATVGIYVNEKGCNLPKKKLRINADNMLEL